MTIIKNINSDKYNNDEALNVNLKNLLFRVFFKKILEIKA